MTSRATTIDDYIADLPEDRRAIISAVRTAIQSALPAGYEEGMQYGMIGYYVPHSRYPDGYHCDPRQPLPFVHIGSQKNHMAIYLFCAYGDPVAEKTLQDGFAAEGKKLDMGKACIRFRKLDDLAMKPILEVIAALPVDAYLVRYEAAIPPSKRKKKAR